jgi:histidinol-phosphate aminotransferase
LQRNVLSFIEAYDPGIFPHDAEERYGIEPEEVTNLASNENPYPPPGSVIEAIRSSLKDINRYPDPSYRRLKEGLSDYTSFPVQNIAVGNGSTEILDMLCKVFLDPFDRISIMSPSYTMYALMGMVREATIEFVRTGNDHRIDVDFLIDRARGSKIVFLCSPNNPTGTTIASENLEAILDGIEGLVVMDEAYAEFSRTSVVDMVPKHPNLIVTRSMSKFFSLAGLRVGYCIARDDIVESLGKIRQPFSISSIAEAAAIAALNEAEYFEEKRELVLTEREYLFDGLSAIDGIKPLPSEANFILVEVEPPVPDMVDRLTEVGVLIRNLEGLSGLEGAHVRITVGTRRQNDILLDALKTVFSR